VAQEESHPLIPNAVASHGGLPKKDPFSPPYIEGLFLGHLTQEEDTEEEFVALVRSECLFIATAALTPHCVAE